MTEFIANTNRVSSTSPGSNRSDIVASLVGVSKQYRLFDDPRDRLKQMLFKHFGKTYGRTFWAVQNINFELGRGEIVAIIGKNGSGKSTILQMIAGTLTPTEGTISCSGRVGALLELGSGFNPDYTGRENIQLNASILGISSDELREKIDSIIEFADIGSYIDQPVKFYSSGMFVRLAFAVSTGLDADVLLIDEALAVGDVFFRQKCYQRLEELRRRGASIILVTHNMVDVEQFCERAILLDHGRELFQGSSSEAVKRYYLLEQEERLTSSMKNDIQFASSELEYVRPEIYSDSQSAQEMEINRLWPDERIFLPVPEDKQVSNGRTRCVGVAICDLDGQPKQIFQQGERAVFYYEFEALDTLHIPIGGIVLKNKFGMIVHGKNSLQYDLKLPYTMSKGSRIRFRQEVSLEITLGEYTFEAGLVEAFPEYYENRSVLDPAKLRSEGILRLCHVPEAGQFIIVARKVGYPAVLMHYGACNLPGDMQFAVLHGPSIANR